MANFRELGWKEGADDRIGSVLSSELDESNVILTGYVVVATYIDSEGEPCLAFNSHPQTTQTATIGMLTHSLEVQKAQVFWDERPDA